MYFDPYLEDPAVRQLTAPERADRLTRPLSVSALPEPEPTLDLDYDALHVEMNDGS
uniref:Uncharacterized protein n=1 Tax=uncultured marine virus TaxID=186617 RepID=A0A1J0KK81_9VIRU|nr:hypothetical protein [uncultured marine virus]